MGGLVIQTITILEETTKNPITLMGKRAGICYNADISDDKKNFDRGLDCLNSGHGRVSEYVNVELVIEGYSARVIREWYTHIGCLPTRLQESTRYIDYAGKGFDYIIPDTISKDNVANANYVYAMDAIKGVCRELKKQNIPEEDIANILPLGMVTKIVDKRNLRNYIDMSHQRMCSRAYWEYRDLFDDICSALRQYSDEWRYIVNNYFVPKCDYLGKCIEKKSCGRYGK